MSKRFAKDIKKPTSKKLRAKKGTRTAKIKEQEVIRPDFTKIGVFLLILVFFTLGFFTDCFYNLVKPTKTTSQGLSPLPLSKPLVNEVAFGKSVEGKEMKGYVIGDGGRSIFLFGSIHGNEMGSNALLERLVIEIKQNPAILSRDTKLIVLPIANPDGFYERIDKLNANGVNLNLNFETTNWENWGGDYHEFAGNNPFSEPESQVIRKIVDDYNVSTMISFHSQGRLAIPEDNQSSKDLARWYAGETGYTYDSESFNYFGTATRWYAEKRNGIAMTVELTDKMDSDWRINKDALLRLISNKI